MDDKKPQTPTARFNAKKSAILKAGGPEAEAIREQKRKDQADYRARKKERTGVVTRTIEATDEEFAKIKELLKSLRESK